MKKGLLGKKIGMTQVYERELAIPVTLIEAGPCLVIQVKTADGRDGYDAIQLGFQDIKENRLNKPLTGRFKSAGVKKYKKYLREIRLEKGEAANYKLNDELKADIFAEGEKVDVCGINKGKGYAGPMKRWNFRGFPAAHGSRYHRAGGSVGASSDPSRVFPGWKMSGQLGNERNTAQNLEVVKVLAEQNILLIKGAVPGANGGLVFVQSAKKQRSAK